jgi:tyrosyl-tRNA synthetase
MSSVEEKIRLIESVGEEIIQKDELKTLLESGEPLIAYDGFEPSGQMHIAQGILRTININRLTKAGVKFKMFVADWHAMANNKMGGDLDKIQDVGNYFIEVWKACGMDMKNVEFIWASTIAKDPEYWKLVVQVGKTNALKRFVRTAEMMGREDSLEGLTGAHVIYSCMQVADIFTLGCKITQLGMDQRKVNMLAREIGPQLGFWKPVVISHHMLRGLGKPIEETTDKTKRAMELKMSKSKPDTALFMTDSSDDVKRKVNKAYCLEGDITDNPILEYCKHIVFASQKDLTIKRPEKFGGTIVLDTYEELERKFEAKEIHPMDLKSAVADALDRLIQPVREHFEKDTEASALLNRIKSYAVTR